MPIHRFTASLDNTITNAFQENLAVRATGSNMGSSDILEVFSIQGQVSGSSGLSSELSRILIQFPISDIISDRSAGNIPASGSVSFFLKLYNAEHSFTLPTNFTIDIFAITHAWEEGSGCHKKPKGFKLLRNWHTEIIKQKLTKKKKQEYTCDC